MARLVRVLRNVEDIYLDENGYLHIVLKPVKTKRTPWIKQSRGTVVGFKDHKTHQLFPINKAKAPRRQL